MSVGKLTNEVCVMTKFMLIKMKKVCVYGAAALQTSENGRFQSHTLCDISEKGALVLLFI